MSDFGDDGAIARVKLVLFNDEVDMGDRKPIAGSYCVFDPALLPDALLGLLVDEAALEMQAAMDGGIMLFDQKGKRLSNLGCCADLLGSREFCESIKRRADDWQTIWNGHDADDIAIRFSPSDDVCEIAVYDWTGTVPTGGGDGVTLHVISSTAADHLARDLATQIEALAARIESILVHRGSDTTRASELAQCGVGIRP